MVWLFFTICSVSLLSFADFDSRKKDIAICITFVLLAMTAGFRNVGGVDTDYQIYMDHYNGEYGTYFRGGWEPGYCFLVWLANQIGLSYNWFVFGLTSLSLYFLVSIIWEKSRLPMFSIMLYLATYFLFYNMVLLRQMVAVVCFIYCLYYIIENKKYQLVVAFFIGLMFHYSIIILLPAYFIIRYLRLNIFSVLLLILSALFLKKMGIENILLSMFDWGGDVLVERTVKYVANQEFSLNIMEYIKMFIILFFIMVRYKSLKNSYENQILLKSYLCFCAMIIAFGNIEIFFRMAMYFDLASLFLLPIIFDGLHFKLSSKIICYCCLSAFVIFSFMYRLMHFSDGEFYNYRFFFL